MLEKLVSRCVQRVERPSSFLRLLKPATRNAQLVLALFFVLLLFRLAWAAIPNAPSNLAATPLSYTQIRLTWTDNSTDETGFYIERKIGAAGNFTQLTTAAANAVSYTNTTGLTADTTYYYRMRSYNASGSSSYSNEVSIPLGRTALAASPVKHLLE